MDTTTNNVYVPGTCNIGPEEIKMRIMSGWIGLIVSVIAAIALVYIPISPWFRLFLFFPATVSALGFLQSAFHFCVAFGMEGLFNVSNAVGKTESVSQQEFRKADKRKAILIITYSVWIGIVIAFGAVYI
jgi:ABC-type uncharacterized transport system permease subunit